MSNQEIDRTKLTFSQAEGIDPLPQPAALGELPGEARTDRFPWTAPRLTLRSVERLRQRLPW